MLFRDSALLDRIFRAFDLNDDDKIFFEEYLSCLSSISTKSSREDKLHCEWNQKCCITVLCIISVDHNILFSFIQDFRLRWGQFCQCERFNRHRCCIIKRAGVSNQST